MDGRRAALNRVEVVRAAALSQELRYFNSVALFTSLVQAERGRRGLLVVRQPVGRDLLLASDPHGHGELVDGEAALGTMVRWVEARARTRPSRPKTGKRGCPPICERRWWARTRHAVGPKRETACKPVFFEFFAKACRLLDSMRETVVSSLPDGRKALACGCGLCLMFQFQSRARAQLATVRHQAWI